MSLVAACLTQAIGADDKAVDAKAAFEKIKGLAGEWTVDLKDQPGAKEQPPMKIIYRVVAAGSAVEESQFPGTDHEMVTMYFLEGDDLRLTHYCARKNQPDLKLDETKSTSDALEFAFDGGTNLDPEKDSHMKSRRMRFISKDRLESEWDGYKGGKKNHGVQFVLTRK